MSKANIQPYLVGSLITSAIGAVLLFVTDFGGWQERMNGDYYYFWIGSENADITGQIILVILGVGLVMCSYLSFEGMRSTEFSPSKLNLGFNIAVGVSIGTIIELFLFINSVSDYEDYWLDAGFYGSLVGSILTAILFKLAKDNA
ncbi:MAG: hypothetical protein ACXAD7_14710 [Candidatus Kariarchaeaceae archaeon]|jgi:hypothetical protein